VGVYRLTRFAPQGSDDGDQTGGGDLDDVANPVDAPSVPDAQNGGDGVADDGASTPSRMVNQIGMFCLPGRTAHAFRPMIKPAMMAQRNDMTCPTVKCLMCCGYP
jgi:hypothetical protein